MSTTPDPFVHHPALRDRIACSESSFFRTFTVDRLIEHYPELEKFRDLTYSDAERETIRAATLGDHEGDLWIFAYGSLMWDPALRFKEVRRCFTPNHARRFILKDDTGGRGSQDAPGLMAALDHGDGCHGLAYRIAAADIDVETEILFRRELIGAAYNAAFIPLQMGEEQVSALTFLANHASPDVVPDIARADQVSWIATGAGFLGSSHDYLNNVVGQLTLLGIADADCAALLKEVNTFLAAETKTQATA